MMKDNSQVKSSKSNKVNIVIGANFTIDPIGESLIWWCRQFYLDPVIEHLPYNQVFQNLIDPQSPLSVNTDFNIIMIRFDDWIQDGEASYIQQNHIHDNFIQLKSLVQSRYGSAKLIVGILPIENCSIKFINLEWKDFLSKQDNTTVLDLSNLGQSYQIRQIYDSLQNQIGHIPYTEEYFAVLGTCVARQILSSQSPKFKVIALDCDNTLWNGICGEIGPQKVEVSSNYQLLQRFLIEQYNKGVLLVLCSKNNIEDVNEVFTYNRGMLLEKHHFITERINWNKKSDNLKEIAIELNVNLDSFIFIDDNPAECLEVMQSCPEILTINLPSENAIPDFLQHIWALDFTRITQEDSKRTAMYMEERKRTAARQTELSFSDFIQTLHLKISIREAVEKDYTRISQLTNRTNQFNLSTIRRTEQEIREITAQTNVKCMIVEAEDKFGAYGISGVIIGEIKQEHFFIDTLLLSCRILGRNVEQVLLAFLYTYAKEKAITLVQADFYPTEKNIPVKNFMDDKSWKKIRTEGNHVRYELNMKEAFYKVVGIECYFGKSLPQIIKKDEKIECYVEFDHIAVAVFNIQKSVHYYKELGYQCKEPVFDPNQNVNLVMCNKDSYCNIELVEPMDASSPVHNLLQQYGEIPYHTCYRVKSVKEFTKMLTYKEIEYEIISPLKEAVLFHGKKVIFLSIAAVGIIELIEMPALKMDDSSFPVKNCLIIETSSFYQTLHFYQMLGYGRTDTYGLEKSGFPTLKLVENQFEKYPYKIAKILYKESDETIFNGAKLEYFDQYKDEIPGIKKDISWNIIVDNDINLLYRNYILALQCHTGSIILKHMSSKKKGLAYDEETDKNIAENPIEFVLNTIKDLLNKDTVIADISFLANGGNSLKAITFISRIHNKFHIALKLEDVINDIPLSEVIRKIEVSGENVCIPIIPVEEQRFYSLTDSQTRLFMFYQLNKDSLVYNMPRVMIIDGKLDTIRFQEAVSALIHRHRILQMNFDVKDGVPYQYIRKEEKFKLKVQQLNGEVTEDKINEIIHRFICPFDLNKDLLIRVSLVKLKTSQSLFLFDVHHIISDGISMGIIINELMQLYHGTKLAPVKIQFMDYIIWQQQYVKSYQVEEQKKYWKNKFHENIPVLQLPTDYKREAVQSFEGTKIVVDLGRELTKSIQSAIEESNVSLYMYLQAAYTIVLSKYSSQNDIIVGCPIAGRSYEEIEDTVGMFVDILPIWNKVNYEVTFQDYLKEVRTVTLNAFENPYFPYEDIVSHGQRDTSRNPIFDTVFILQNMDNKDFVLCNMEFGGIASEELKFSLKDFSLNVAKYDLTMEAVEGADNIYFSIEYCTKLFTEATIRQLFQYYSNVLKQVVSNANILMSDISLLDQKESLYLAEKLNTIGNWHVADTIQAMFERIVERNPNHIAVSMNGEKLTYQKLNEKSNQLADYLRKLSVKPDNLVGLLLERSFYVPIAIIGIIKAGGAYLPIETEYPDNRIDFMIKDSEISVLITDKGNSNRKISSVKHTVLIDEEEQFMSYRKTNPFCVINSDNLVYVIYTSGTTGNPKGVMVEHHSLLNYVLWRIKQYNFTSDDITLQLLPVAFDGFGSNFYSAILSGGELVYMDKDSWRDFQLIRKTIYLNGVTNLSVVPTMYRGILEEASSEELMTVRFVVLAGESSNRELIELSQKIGKNIQLMNEYGPTEGTIATTAFLHMTPDCFNVIGRPLSNINVFVVDKFHNILPRKVPGELCISGVGLSRGYYNNTGLTNEKFRKESKITKELIYKTGDIVKLDDSGNLVYLGRSDYQVKIRGYRVELSEIESQILQYPGINQVVVLTTHKEEDVYLCSYMVCKDLNLKELRKFLAARIPAYMIPEFFVVLDEIPMTINGKIDQKKLFAALPAVEETQDVKPNGIVESRVVQICKDILKRNKVGMHDDFFFIGGDSLKAARLLSRVSKEFHIDIPMNFLFQNPVIEDISRYIKEMNRQNYSPITQALIQKTYPMSSSQKRIYILSQMEDVGTSYNMPLMIEFYGRVDRNRLSIALKEIILQEEILRTTFTIVNQEPVQIVHSGMRVDVSCCELNDGNLQRTAEQFIKPFDLENGPLIRVGIFESRDKDILLLDIHHIVADGISIGIILKKLSKCYKNESLDRKEIQFKDFAVWQKASFNNARIQKQKEYWLNLYSGDIPVLNYITDYERPLQIGYKGAEFKVPVIEFLFLKMRELEMAQKSTAFMILLAVFYTVLARISNQEDIIVGTPLAGRNHPDSEDMVGNFVNTIALRNRPEMDKKFLEFLNEVKDNFIRAYENQDFHFEELVDALKLDKNTKRRPLFDVMFVMRNMEKPEVDFSGLTYQILDFNTNVSKYDITLTATEEENTITLNFQYNTQLFRHETIQKISEYYLKLLEEIVNNPNQCIGCIPMMSQQDEERLLSEFNHSTCEEIKNTYVMELFQKQVAKTPNLTAIVYHDKSLTYEQLNQMVMFIGTRLRGTCLPMGNTVAILAKPSLEMIIAMLSVLQAGYTYLPIDSSQPMERIRYFLSDSDAKILLIQNKEMLKDTVDEVSIWDLEELFKEAKGEVGLRSEYAENDLAYMIYTSGTTGKQKGVLVKQKGLINYVYWFLKKTGMQAKEKAILLSSYAFDLGYSVIYPTLLSGGELHLIDKEECMDSEFILSYIRENNISYMKVTPTLFSMIQRVDANGKEHIILPLKMVVLGGERINVEEVQKFHKKHPYTRILNHYGPTETTIGAIAREINFDEIDDYARIPDIGRPITNMKVYILNKTLSPVPINTIGEIYIQGPGVALGYYKKEELTRERFVKSPFGSNNARMYRTGDYGRFLPDGNIEFIGRADNQIKIRGYRIELSEIESILLQSQWVTNAVIGYREDIYGNNYLVAYYMSNILVDEKKLKLELLGKLPEYMVPSYFLHVQELPANQNGKIDMRALEQIEVRTVKETFSVKTPLEEELMVLWQEILGISKIGCNDNFFDIGGNSLSLIYLYQKLNERYPGKLRVAQLFQYPTIVKLADFLEKNHVMNMDYGKFQLKMPEEYFLNDRDTNHTTYFCGYLPEVLEYQLRHLCENKSFDFESVLLGVFIYILSQESNTKIISSQYIAGRQSKIYQVTADLTAINNFQSYFQEIMDQMHLGIVSIENIDDINHIPVKKEYILPIFIIDGKAKLNQKIAEEYDICFGVEFNKSPRKVFCTYNVQILNEIKVKEFMNNYLKVLEYITNIIN